MIDTNTKDEYLKILHEELLPAMGCTEPIALAYAGAKARTVLGCKPERITAECSGNIIKNVRCVTIPHSGGMTGVEAAVTIGTIGGNAEKLMEVLEDVSDGDIAESMQFIEEQRCEVKFLESETPLHIIVTISNGGDEVIVEIRHAHTHITRIEKSGNILYENNVVPKNTESKADRGRLNINDIKEFADTVSLCDISPIYDRVISENMNIAFEGMAGDYGVGIGRVLRASFHDDVYTRMKSYAAAASEARMSGCEMPVIINSGSGNQGIASTVPVIVYAREMNIHQSKLYRALALSSLTTIYQKEYIGLLSAFCGAVSASCAAGAAVTYMAGGSTEQIKDTIANTLANVPGIICDGAKPSCAAKIATSLDAAILAHSLSMNGRAYGADVGILKKDTGDTIKCVGYIGREGMRQTDKEIIKVMLER